MFALLIAMEAPPDTSGYMIAGYVVIFVAILAYIASLFIRQRKLSAEFKMLQEVKGQEGETEKRGNPVQVNQ